MTSLPLDPVLLIGGGALLLALLLALYAQRNAQARAERQLEEMRRFAEGLARAQSEVAGRVGQMADGQTAMQTRLAEQLQGQERQIRQALEERLAEVNRRVGLSLQESSESTQKTVQGLSERLAVIDAAQKNIHQLSQQMISLQDILANKQARGAFGEIQLQDLVQGALPPDAYAFQVTLSNNRRADCLLHLPKPPGDIVIDAKFPLEAYYALRDAPDDAARAQARKALGVAVLKHVKDIQERYMILGETADSALMFLPSEAVYAELHANLPDVVQQGFRARVYIVSPTTLMATLNTVRSVLRDARMREQADLLQKEILRMVADVGRLQTRVENLDRHFGQASEDLRQIRTSTEKIGRRAKRIEEVELGDETERDDALSPAAQPPAAPVAGPVSGPVSLPRAHQSDLPLNDA